MSIKRLSRVNIIITTINGNNGNNEKANYIYQCEVHQDEFEESYMSDLLTTCTKCDLTKTRYTREFFDKINKPQST